MPIYIPPSSSGTGSGSTGNFVSLNKTESISGG